jgi:hypothetical protein
MHWRAGNIARNLGTILGLPGISSLLPLFVILAVVASLWFGAARKTARAQIKSHMEE